MGAANSTSISSTLLFYEGNSGFSIEPMDTSAFRLEDDRSTPSATAAQVKLESMISRILHLSSLFPWLAKLST